MNRVEVAPWYTARGEFETLVLPGGITHRYTYNAGGQLGLHRIENAGTTTGRYPTPLIRDETLSYDWRGKLVSAANRQGVAVTMTARYLGLGHLQKQPPLVLGAELARQSLQA